MHFWLFVQCAIQQCAPPSLMIHHLLAELVRTSLCFLNYPDTLKSIMMILIIMVLMIMMLNLLAYNYVSSINNVAHC